MRQTSTTIAEKQIPTGALGYALRCAAAGRPVLPCKPRQKVPATPHGVHDATLDPATIAAWSRRKPGGNWGGACGNGVVVLDFDGPGADALAASLELPPAPRMDTARGFQLTFSYQGELPAALYDAQGAKQGDVKASGCCMLPGSVHPSGVLYVARDGWSPIGPPLPEHSADRIRQAHEAAHPKPAPPPGG